MNHLIFDIDGTIWNTTAVVAQAWNRAVREFAIPELRELNITDKILQKEFGKPMDVIADNLFGDIDQKLKSDLLNKCCEYEHEAIAACDDDLSYDKIREVMHELAKNNKLYIVSNCQDGYIELVMKKNHIEDIIADIECFGHTGLQKDENIRLVLERNGVIDNAYYIGDTLGDYNATMKAGIKFVFAEYGFGKVPDFFAQISAPVELLEVFK